MKELFRIIFALWHARKIQDFLWNKPGERVDESGSNSSYEDWVRTLDSRIYKLNAVNPSNPHWKVEAIKRALQVTAVSIAMVTALRRNKIKPQEEDSNK